MKKYISITLIITILLVGILSLTGCENTNNDNDTSKSGGVDLKLDFKHVNDKIYYAHINTTADDKVTEFDEEEPYYVRIENEKDNYVLELTLDSEAKDEYEQLKTSTKEENEIYEETKFGKYNGYYSNNNGIYGYILLDTTDSTFCSTLMFCIELLDNTSENNDIQTIFNSSKIQNILNNVEYNSKN